MQISMYKIFGTIKSLYTLMLLLAALLTVTIASEYASFYKLENLQNEKDIATAVYNLGRDDLDLANIQYRGKNAMLRHESNALSGFYEYDYINKFSKAGNYQNELSKLQYAVNDFNVAAGDWYTQDQISEEELQTRKEQFTKTYNLLMTQINTITSQNNVYEEKRFLVQMSLIVALLLLTLFSTFWASRRLAQIQGDVKTLNMLEQDEVTEFSTLEADSISKRMGRTTRASATKNPAYLDSVTGISSYKGFIHEYGEKKSQKLGNYTAICIFSIDRLNELEMQYSQEFSEALVKKVSFMLSLYRQHNDVIGRLDHNQFAILLSRQDKTSAVNDCELVRKSVEETSFKTADGKNLTVTLSGGFVQKMSTQNLDEVLAKANKVLSKSIQHGGNRIAQLRDKSAALK
ncbi:MAG: diguanylate cyclase [Sulfurimonadaceae bacterium]